VRTLASMKKGSPPRVAVTLSHSLPIDCALSPSCFFVPRPHRRLCPFAFALLSSTPSPPCTPWLRLVTPTASSLRRRSTWCVACLGGARQRTPQGSAPALLPSAISPLGSLFLFVSYVSCGLALPISPFFLLLLEEFGLQLQHLTPHSILQAAIFVHLCEMFVGVAPCTSLFRHFFVLIKSGKARDHLGAYYFQTRPDSAIAYISTFGGT
jgi:hypothetical protein